MSELGFESRATVLGCGEKLIINSDCRPTYVSATRSRRTLVQHKNARHHDVLCMIPCQLSVRSGEKLLHFRQITQAETKLTLGYIVPAMCKQCK